MLSVVSIRYTFPYCYLATVLFPDINSFLFAPTCYAIAMPFVSKVNFESQHPINFVHTSFSWAVEVYLKACTS